MHALCLLSLVRCLLVSLYCLFFLLLSPLVLAERDGACCMQRRQKCPPRETVRRGHGSSKHCGVYTVSLLFYFFWCISCLLFLCLLVHACRLGLGLLAAAAGPSAEAPVAAEALALLLRAWSSWASRLLLAADTPLLPPEQQQQQQTRLADTPWWHAFRDASALLVEAFVHK